MILTMQKRMKNSSGYVRVNPRTSEKIRVNQSKSENVRENQRKVVSYEQIGISYIVIS